jgi:hypothetical protein
MVKKEDGLPVLPGKIHCMLAAAERGGSEVGSSVVGMDRSPMQQMLPLADGEVEPRTGTCDEKGSYRCVRE